MKYLNLAFGLLVSLIYVANGNYLFSVKEVRRVISVVEESPSPPAKGSAKAEQPPRGDVKPRNLAEAFSASSTPVHPRHPQGAEFLPVQDVAGMHNCATSACIHEDPTQCPHYQALLGSLAREVSGEVTGGVADTIREEFYAAQQRLLLARTPQRTPRAVLSPQQVTTGYHGATEPHYDNPLLSDPRTERSFASLPASLSRNPGGGEPNDDRQRPQTAPPGYRPEDITAAIQHLQSLQLSLAQQKEGHTNAAHVVRTDPSSAGTYSPVPFDPHAYPDGLHSHGITSRGPLAGQTQHGAMRHGPHPSHEAPLQQTGRAPSFASPYWPTHLVQRPMPTPEGTYTAQALQTPTAPQSFSHTPHPLSRSQSMRQAVLPPATTPLRTGSTAQLFTPLQTQQMQTPSAHTPTWDSGADYMTPQGHYGLPAAQYPTVSQTNSPFEGTPEQLSATQSPPALVASPMTDTSQDSNPPSLPDSLQSPFPTTLQGLPIDTITPAAPLPPTPAHGNQQHAQPQNAIPPSQTPSMQMSATSIGVPQQQPFSNASLGRPAYNPPSAQPRQPQQHPTTHWHVETPDIRMGGRQVTIQQQLPPPAHQSAPQQSHNLCMPTDQHIGRPVPPHGPQPYALASNAILQTHQPAGHPLAPTTLQSTPLSSAPDTHTLTTGQTAYAPIISNGNSDLQTPLVEL